MALLHQVEQAARRRDEDVDAARQRIDLRLLADAAEDHGVRGAADAGRSVRKLSAIWTASSRVGVRISTRADSRGAARALAARRCRIGSAKAAVLPVPVWAMPSRSRPASRCGNGLRLDRRRLGVALGR